MRYNLKYQVILQYYVTIVHVGRKSVAFVKLTSSIINIIKNTNNNRQQYKRTLLTRYQKKLSILSLKHQLFFVHKMSWIKSDNEKHDPTMKENCWMS